MKKYTLYSRMELDFCNGEESNECYSFECHANTQLEYFLGDIDPSLLAQIEQAEDELRQQQNDDYQHELKRHEIIEQEKDATHQKIKKEPQKRKRTEAEREKNRLRTQEKRIQKRKLEEQLKESKELAKKCKSANIVVVGVEQSREAELQRQIQEQIAKQKELVETRRKLLKAQKKLLRLQKRKRPTLIKYTKFECTYPDPITGEKCIQTARYGFEPRKPIYCRSHYRYGRRGIYNVFHTKCIDPNCFRSAFYGTQNPKQYIACRDHRDPSHVRFTLHMCQVCDHAYDANDRDCLCHPKKND